MSKLRGRNKVEHLIPTIIGEHKYHTPTTVKLVKFDKDLHKIQNTWFELPCTACGKMKKANVPIIKKYFHGDPKRYLCKECRIEGKDTIKQAINVLNIRKARAKGLIK